MKKTTNNKRLSTVLIAMAMTASMAMTALAVPNPQPEASTPGDFTNNAATTTVNLEGMSDGEIDGNLSATVPLAVTLAILGDGTAKGPDNYTIQNTSKTKKIKVSNVAGVPLNNSYVLQGGVSDTQVYLGDVHVTPTLPGGGHGADLKLSAVGVTNGVVPPDVDTAWTLDPAGTTGAQTATSVTLRFGGAIDDVAKLPSDATSQGGQQAFSLTYTIEKTT